MIEVGSTQRDQPRTCSICLEGYVTDEHVGIHLQQIALFALLRSTGMEGDSHLGDDVSAAAVDDLEGDREGRSDIVPFQGERNRPLDPDYGVINQNAGKLFADLDPYQMAPDKRYIAVDWSVVYNPQLPRELDNELIHSTYLNSSVECVKFSYNGDFLAIGLHGSAEV